MSTPNTVNPKPVWVRCLLGSGVFAPCPDDLCHGVDTTLCGLERGFDFCQHDQDPDACTECREIEEFYADDDYDPESWEEHSAEAKS